VNYLWSPATGLSDPSISNPVATPTSSIVYHVQVTAANGCTNEDSIRVNVIAGVADNGFVMPNAFTPNGDGRNDCFGVKHWGNISNLKFIVYNRWGEVVFKTTDPSQCWDGVYKSEKQTTSVFVYQVWADTFCGKVYRDGTVTVIR
jgi:gliding motility-associated-like protein